MEKDQKFLEVLLKAIVKNPNKVRTERSIDSDGIFLRAWVDKEDMGLIVGKGGNHANAIRLVMKLVGFALSRTPLNVKIEEPEEI